MPLRSLPTILALTAATLILGGCQVPDSKGEQAQSDQTMRIQFLEIVTPDVDGTCGVLEQTQGLRFSSPVAEFGNARIADLEGGGIFSVRAPMRPSEQPVVRPYLLVEDIEAAVRAAQAAGAEIAHPPLEIPGRGTFAIYILGGVQHGLWQL